MRVSLAGGTDYLALLTGNAEHIRLKFSASPRATAAKLSRCRDQDGRVILLFGANGFVGTQILQALLLDDRVAKIYALARGKRNLSGSDRILRAMSQYGMSAANARKLEIWETDFTRHEMGLPAPQYLKLCADVDAVVHAAGSTNHLHSYRRHKKESISMLLRLMEFCMTRRSKSLHYIGSSGCEVYRQRRDFFRFGFFHCGYSRMKWVVKHIVRHAYGEGVPAHIYLAPWVLGSKATQYKDPGLRYSFWQMLWYVNKLGMIWDSKGETIPILPGDLLAKRVVDNIFAKRPENIVYAALHLSSRELAHRFGWEHVTWAQFHEALLETFSLDLRKFNWRSPLASVSAVLRDVFFSRGMFPRYLPEVLDNIGAASRMNTLPMRSDVAAIDIVWECVTKNHLRRKIVLTGRAGPSGRCSKFEPRTASRPGPQ